MPSVLITGASSGIGRATSLRLARSGWSVLAGVRDASVGERLEAEAPAGRIRALALELTDGAHLASAAEIVRAEYGGRLDALVNNAGMGVGGPLELLSADRLREQFEVNVFAQVALTRALLPALRAAQGRIVLVSSIGGLVATPFTAPYAASKHALEAIGDCLRVELRSSHVQVALIEPGSVATPIWDKGREQAASLEIPAEYERLYGAVPAALGRVMEQTARRGIGPEAVAQTIERALGARRMRSRYLVGRDARIMLTLRRALPDRAFDAVLRRAMHLS